MHQYVSEGKTKIRGESPLETLRNFNAPSKRPHGFTFTWWGCSCLCLWHKPTELAHSFLFCSCVCFCLYGTFNCVSFHKFSRQLSAFSLCSTGLISALLVLSAICLFTKVSLSPDIILCGWLGLKLQQMQLLWSAGYNQDPKYNYALLCYNYNTSSKQVKGHPWVLHVAESTLSGWAHFSRALVRMNG